MERCRILSHARLFARQRSGARYRTDTTPHIPGDISKLVIHPVNDSLEFVYRGGTGQTLVPGPADRMKGLLAVLLQALSQDLDLG